jgi:4,4'-diaponeurosporenoate glycosyltransferase
MTSRAARLALLAEALRWAAGAWLLARLPDLRDRNDHGAEDRIDERAPAVVVPARNEAGALPRLLRSLRSQTTRPAEVLVVDDASEDATAAVAHQERATVVSPGPVPAGWTGKTWACQTGVHATTASLIVLLDADVELGPGGLQRLLDEYERGGGRGLLSVMPVHVAARPHQRLSAISQLVAAMGTGAFSPLARWTAAPAAFGPCMVFRREDYLAAGGHAGVRSEQAEDLALARRFAATSAPVRLVSGKPLVGVHMYPDGPGQLVNGWARTLAAGARATRPLTLVLVVAWISGLIASAWAFAATLINARRGRSVSGWRRDTLTELARYVAYALQVEWLLGRVGTFGAGTGLAFPLPLTAFLASFTRSCAARAGWGRLAWKGRPVSLGEATR